MSDDKRGKSATVGAVLAGSLYGGLVVGGAGIIGALGSFLTGNAASGGICLLASAFAFGLLANACLRQ